MIAHILMVDIDPRAAQVTSAVVPRAILEALVEVAPTYERTLLTSPNAA